MAVKASGLITLAAVTDVSAVTPYYKAQTSTLSPPNKPTTVPPSGWSATQPTVDTSNTCYIVWLIEYSNGTWGYSDVSTFSEYEAAKAAQATASSALATAQSTEQHFWFTGTGEDAGAHITKVTKAEFLSNPEAAGGNFLAQADKVAVRDGTKEMAAFGLFGQQMTNREGVRYFSLDSLNSTGDMFAKAGPYEPTTGETETIAVLPVIPTSGKPIYTSVDGASGMLFEMTAGTAGESQTTRFGVTYKVTYDGEQTLTAQVVIPEHDEQGRPAGTYGARISAISYWADTNMPSMTFGTSQGDRGKFSATFGEGLMAQYQNQVAVGMYNENISDDIFEVGGGTDDSTRKTLFAVEASGDITAAAGVNADGGFYAKNPSSVTFTGTKSNAIYRGECFGTYDYATGFVTLIFHFYNTSDIPTSYTLFTIPSQFRPSTTRYGAAFYTVGSSWISYHCYVTNGGIVRQDVSGSTRSGFGVIKYILN